MIYRVEACAFCGKEIREPHISTMQSITDDAFDKKTWSLILVSPKGTHQTWHICEDCKNKTISYINEGLC